MPNPNTHTYTYMHAYTHIHIYVYTPQTHTLILWLFFYIYVSVCEFRLDSSRSMAHMGSRKGRRIDQLSRDWTTLHAPCLEAIQVSHPPLTLKLSAVMGERGVRGNKRIRYIYHMLNCVRILFYVITGNWIQKFCPSSSLKYLPSSKGKKKEREKEKEKKQITLAKKMVTISNPEDLSGMSYRVNPFCSSAEDIYNSDKMSLSFRTSLQEVVNFKKWCTK